MKEFQYRYVPKPAMCLQEYPPVDKTGWLQVDGKHELNDDMFYQRMARDDQNITSYKLGICRLKSKMRNYPEEELEKVLNFLVSVLEKMFKFFDDFLGS